MDESLVVVYRSILAFASLFVYARVLGKQQISELTFFEYVTGITIGSIAASMSVDLTSKALPHWIALSVWFLLTYLLQLIVLKSAWLGRFISGKPVVIIQNGKILEQNMAALRHRIGDLMTQLRQKGVFDISQVENAVFETSGQLSVQLKSQYRPLTPKDMGISTPYEGLTHELIVEGQVDEKELEKVGLTEKWLTDALRAQGIKNATEVFLASLNTQGELFVAPYESRAGSAYSQTKEGTA